MLKVFQTERRRQSVNDGNMLVLIIGDSLLNLASEFLRFLVSFSQSEYRVKMPTFVLGL